ncbi:MAG: protein-disulfide reductase DsbD domain-containing protein [bacterium]
MYDNIKRFSTDYLTGTIGITDSVAYRSQLLSIVIDISMKDGFHLYGQPLPEGYIPFKVAVAANRNFTVDDFMFPKTTEFEIASLGETFSVLPEKLNLKTFMRIINKPKAGHYTVNVTLTFQACNDKICLAPADLKFDFPLRIINEEL